MRKNLIVGLFLCVAFIQLATPLSMIVKREAVLKNGKQFKFKTAPVDPYDAFRGRYVALRIEQDSVSVDKNVKFAYGERVYAHIRQDAEGFATFFKVTRERPQGENYIKTKVRYTSGSKVHLELPFDRYYMQEKAAPLAEKAYRKHSRRGSQDAYVAVRIKSGFAVLEELYIAKKPILEFIKENQE